MSSVECGSTKLPLELWQHVFILLPSLEDLFRTSAVCHLFRSLILKNWFLKRYLTKNRLRLKDNLQIWLKLSNKDNIYENSIPAEESIAESITECCPEVKNFFYTKNKFFNHKPCLIHNNSKIHLNYLLGKTGFYQWTLSFWIFIKNNQLLETVCIYLYYNIENPLQIILNFADACVSMRDKKEENIVRPCNQLQSGEWIHVAIVNVFEPFPSVKLYIDGIEICEYIVLNYCLLDDPLSKLYISNECYFGRLADLCFWSRQLSRIEICSIAEQKTSIDLVDIVKTLIGT
ncbi:hypothetical protein I4U23_012134 [Adineta vaga]|nr:hypothetical protein I4U23_012134 [Adineta vaga]